MVESTIFVREGGEVVHHSDGEYIKPLIQGTDKFLQHECQCGPGHIELYLYTRMEAEAK